MKYKLAILDSHPIQYRAPLFERLAQSPQIDLWVYYCSNYGVTEKKDEGFGVRFKWDVSLLEGYNYKFLRNYSIFPSIDKAWGLFNPGIIRELSNGRFDAIIIYGYSFFTNWIVSVVSGFLKIPVIFSGETLMVKRPTAIKNLFFNFFFRNIKACLYIGTKSLEFYQYLRVPRERLFFTPYCVDNDFFISQIKEYRAKKSELKKELGIPGDLAVILYLSKMVPRKRPQDVLRAFEKIQAKAILVFVGDGKQRPVLEDCVYNHKIKNVFFLGFKNYSELARYYAIADIFIMPSSYEPWGLVINEAMCAGLPIITTSFVSSSFDLVRHQENGYIVSVGDIDKMADSLNELIADSEKRKKMGERSLEIISGWNYDACVKAIRGALEFIKAPN